MSAQAQAGAFLLGSDIEFFFASDACGVLSATVVDPGVEFPGAGPDLCMAGETPRLDVDITDNTLRIDFTAEQDFGFGGGPSDFFTLREINPRHCGPDEEGIVTGLPSVTTNMETDEWIPSQVSFSDHEVVIIGDAAGLGGDDPNNIRAHPGDFIEIEMSFGCVGGPTVAPTLSLVGGPCPSLTWTLSMTGYTPGGTIAILKGTGPGSDVLGGGFCAGGVTGLAGMSPVTSISADSAGNFTQNPTLGGPSCGKWIQGLDMTTCTFSPAIPIP